ncbi:LA_2478/LA_2722/LA_4182 family protein [Leptospira sp. 'Mane']|uniref:LA_2478/LA_2722/LA_4182 family protein n=1 Tax=Leptospira sp. 'Mane' TaxID=3387407 RepID=UPI00398A6FDC
MRISKIFTYSVFYILILSFGFFCISCKKGKGIDSNEWKEESLKITASLCDKYRKCADPDWKEVPDKLKDFTKSRLDETNCQKTFRDSNAYKLIGENPENIKSLYRECSKKILIASCDELKQGRVDSLEECKSFKKIQSGN